MINYNFKNYYIDFNSNSKNRHDEIHQTTISDYGPNPLIFNAKEMTSLNQNYRSTLWTGNHFQVTLMSIPPAGDIGAEVHNDVDQLIKIEDGNGSVKIGPTQASMNYEHQVSKDFAIIIPAGFWHNIINSGNSVLRLFSVYAPPVHEYGTINQNKPND